MLEYIARYVARYGTTFKESSGTHFHHLERVLEVKNDEEAIKVAQGLITTISQEFYDSSPQVTLESLTKQLIPKMRGAAWMSMLPITFDTDIPLQQVKSQNFPPV